jgi:DNA-binding transcriptional LysR family regulator
MSFDPRLLNGAGVIAAVAEAGNFARAAETLGLTPSGVSRAVARLEARVGVRLFDRTPRLVRLTEEGQRFHAHIIPLLAGLEEAASNAAGAAAVVSGRLRVSVDPWFARMILAPAPFSSRGSKLMLVLSSLLPASRLQRPWPAVPRSHRNADLNACEARNATR